MPGRHGLGDLSLVGGVLVAVKWQAVLLRGSKGVVLQHGAMLGDVLGEGRLLHRLLL